MVVQSFYEENVQFCNIKLLSKDTFISHDSTNDTAAQTSLISHGTIERVRQTVGLDKHLTRCETASQSSILRIPISNKKTEMLSVFQKQSIVHETQNSNHTPDPFRRPYKNQSVFHRKLALKFPGRNKLSLHFPTDAYRTLLLGTGPHCVANSSLALLAELR